MGEMDTHDLAIGNYRVAHEGALLDRAHPEHALRVEELTGLHEQKAAGDPAPVSSVPANIDGAIAEHRSKHSAALYDRSHPEHALRTEELTRLFQSKFGSTPVDATPSSPIAEAMAATPDDIDRALQPAQQPSDYDFSKLELPGGWEEAQGTDLERWSREWLHAGEVSPAEARALAMEYVSVAEMDPYRVQALEAQTEATLRQKYGADVGKVATAALKAADDFPEMRTFLEHSGLMSSSRVINHLIRVAGKRGYLEGIQK